MVPVTRATLGRVVVVGSVTLLVTVEALYLWFGWYPTWVERRLDGAIRDRRCP